MSLIPWPLASILSRPNDRRRFFADLSLSVLGLQILEVQGYLENLVMGQAREGPYVWVSWLSKLLAGDAHCEWALWFRAHYTYVKQKDETFDLATWKAAHGELVRTRARELRESGYEVFVEDQNKFALNGAAGALGGKPDIIAIHGDEVLVIDCKTGTRRSSDVLQVLVYMRVLPYVRPMCKDKHVLGEVRYLDSSVPVPANALTSDIKSLISTMMARACGVEPAAKVPSYAECSFCDITSGDCAERIEQEPAAEDVDHDIF